MTKKQLERHRRNLILFENKERKLEELAAQEPDTIIGKVKCTSKNFPFLPGRVSVHMYDPQQEENLKIKVDKIKEEALSLLKTLKEVELFVNSIEDDELRELFTLRYIEGLTQREVAENLHMERSTVSKKITNYINSHNSQIEYAIF